MIYPRHGVDKSNHYKISPACWLEQVAEDCLIMRVDKDTVEDLVSRNEMIKNYLLAIENSFPKKVAGLILDKIVSYDSLLLRFDARFITLTTLVKELRKVGLSLNNQNDTTKDLLEQTNGRVHTIDVCYTYASDSKPNDIDLVASKTGLSIESLIALHQEPEYKVFAVGFMPHFAYLGEVHEKLQVARLAQPRLKVPAGAVAIADNQTAIYPNVTPGGWHIIGYTATQFNPELSIGPNDTVKFNAVNLETFQQQEQSAPCSP